MILGFLPFDNTIGDRIFISAVVFIAVHLAWMRWLEKTQYNQGIRLVPDGLNLLGATFISLVLAYLIIRRG